MVGDTVAGVLAHVRKAVADDQVQIEVVEAGRAQPGLARSTTTRSA